MNKKIKTSSTIRDKFATAIGIILCLILLPILIINITLLIKSYINPDKVPSIGGIVPMVVLTDSMYPTIESGDVVINHIVDAGDIKVDDIITFFDPNGDGMSTVIHRVVEVTELDGQIAFRTKGDANNTEDIALVTEDKLIGLYSSRIKGAGNISIFMSTPTGLIVCVVIPLVLFIGYDVVRRTLYEKKHKDEKDALIKELEQLRAEKNKENDKNI